MSTQTALDVRRVGGRIGAEIVGVDLSASLDDAVLAEIRAALLAHQALFFRDQHLDDAGQQRLLATFGPLTTAHPTVPPADGEPNVLEVSGEEGVRSNQWHTDVTFVVSPPAITSLRALVVPPYGGNTLIANTATAYADLPEPLRLLADSLWAIHTNDYDYLQPQFQTDRAAEYRKTFVAKTWETAHPVVRVHPETGRRNLFIGSFTQRLVGLSGTESRDVLRLLQAYVTRPENVVRWQWSPGDLVLFDNRTTQHYAPDDYGDLPRTLHRVTVAGDVPVSVDGRRSYVVSGDDAAHYTPALG
ncbi:MAG TPA: TauD/TfdA family dioxygenase [Kineosporiaceae bacterium]